MSPALSIPSSGGACRQMQCDRPGVVMVAARASPFLPPRPAISGRAGQLHVGSPLMPQHRPGRCPPPPSVAAVEPSTTDDQELARLAEEYGYLKIGKEFPKGVTLSDIVKSLPPEVMELDHAKSWRAVGLTLSAVAGSLGLVALAPWYLLPFAWFLAGTAATGMFVVGHDCGHRSFHRNNLVEDVVGTVMMAPLIYPFEPWRIKHNAHHAHTNKLEEDTAWHPIRPGQFEKSSPAWQWSLRLMLGSPLKCFTSIAHWAMLHFNINLYTEKQRPRVLVSWAAVAAFVVLGFPAIIANLGWGGFVKFWLMPWLGYHFWMSTFTVVHHTAPHIPFKDAKDWNAAEAQLAGSVHCNYPAWVDTLTHDIAWHVPHHVCAKIPWYNLRAATESLRENWGVYMTEANFNWRMMKSIFTELHVYDKEKNYIPIDHAKPEKFFTVQRKILPNSM
eukprot:evm.model.scf_2828.1 EVM.evm.TU.scf_2828.1   scf_2828:2413-3747(-)